MKVLGLLPYADETELKSAASHFDPAFMVELAQLYDRLGYHRILTAQSARSPDSLPVAAWLAGQTKQLGFMIAHRPGFVAPTMAARMLATIDRESAGRAAVHIITATNDQETRCDGDFLTKDDRYRRSREYVEILRKTWASETPFDHEGEFYRLEQACAMLRPEAGSIPVYWGGASGLGVQYGGECADVYALAGTSVARAEELMDQVRAAGAPHGRTPAFLMSIRIVIAETDAAAWDRANSMAATLAEQGSAKAGLRSGSDASAARRVEEALVACGPDDPQLWGGVIEATGGKHHAMALVGGPETLVETLKRYAAIGVEQVILRGFDNLADAEMIGRTIIPALAKV
jgi:alkanesulfonate monooxygenase